MEERTRSFDLSFNRKKRKRRKRETRNRYESTNCSLKSEERDARRRIGQKGKAVELLLHDVCEIGWLACTTRGEKICD